MWDMSDWNKALIPGYRTERGSHVLWLPMPGDISDVRLVSEFLEEQGQILFIYLFLNN